MKKESNCLDSLAEKWKHPKTVLPGEVDIISYCALDSAPYRPALDLIWYRAGQRVWNP